MSEIKHPPQPESGEGSKSGLKEGETPNTVGPKGGARPVKEEDVFGGAERTRNPNVKSGNAKP